MNIILIEKIPFFEKYKNTQVSCLQSEKKFESGTTEEQLIHVMAEFVALFPNVRLESLYWQFSLEFLIRDNLVPKKCTYQFLQFLIKIMIYLEF